MLELMSSVLLVLRRGNQTLKEENERLRLELVQSLQCERGNPTTTTQRV
jgi:hypothetical protein